MEFAVFKHVENPLERGDGERKGIRPVDKREQLREEYGGQQHRGGLARNASKARERQYTEQADALFEGGCRTCQCMTHLWEIAYDSR